MSNVSKQRWGQSFKKGRRTEERFTRAQPGCIKSSREDDINKHIDFYFGESSVDVKGDNMLDEIWVEIKNVRGENGWLFGEAEWIAFDMPELQGFACVKRVDLVELVKEVVDKVYTTKAKAYRKLYQRKDREDVITLLVHRDIRSIPSYMVMKYSMEYKDPLSGETIKANG
ncbi:MAG: hypothetical protein HRT61_00460 [Ekhidna sp.]|nr:hypothetical protein [Ekhidna sp.]